MTSKQTRSDIATAVSKAIAYRDCGRHDLANTWAIRLVEMLQAEEILKPELVIGAAH
jgi:hypothetical protein